MVINSWFGYGTDMLQVIILSKGYGNKRRIVIVGLGFFFLFILMNIQIHTISLIYFLL